MMILSFDSIFFRCRVTLLDDFGTDRQCFEEFDPSFELDGELKPQAIIVTDFW
jgi:hypothetical protein